MSEKKKKKNSTVCFADTVLVIGGGASGLMAAIMAARAGAKVTLLEQNEKNGKKLNATGNGKCNFTNANWDENSLRGEHPEFAKSALAQFSVSDTIDFFTDLGVVPLEKNGYFYPKSGQASSVSALLHMEAAALGVKMKSREHVTALQRYEGTDAEENSVNGWQALTEGWHYEAPKVILACGSCASAISGSDGSGYDLAKSLGHRIVKPLPALTGLKLKASGKLFSKWAGVRFEGRVVVLVDQKKAAEAAGELQLTDYGISGIPVFQVSRYATRALEEGRKVEVVLDFLPEISKEKVISLLEERKQRCPYKSEQELCLGWLPDKLAAALSDTGDFVKNLKELQLSVRESMPFAQAQVASGGVDVTEIDEETMESKLQRGIYFCGELVDIDGTCGGYNLQWAWSSGAVAGLHAAGKESK